MIRSRIFLANRLNHVRLISKGIQHLHDILLMQLAHHRIIYIIEVFSHPYTLITCKRNRFREHRTIDIVDWAPWTIYPMGTCLQDIMLEIVLVDNQQTILAPFSANSLIRLMYHGFNFVRSYLLSPSQAVPCPLLAKGCS